MFRIEGDMENGGKMRFTVEGKGRTILNELGTAVSQIYAWISKNFDPLLATLIITEAVGKSTDLKEADEFLLSAGDIDSAIAETDD